MATHTRSTKSATIAPLGTSVSGKVPDDKKLTFREGRKVPSYISPSTFSAVALDLLPKPEAGPPEPQAGPPAAGTLEARVAALDSVFPGGGVEAQLEKWFNDAMDRLSGGYKRYVKLFLLGFAVAVTVGFNVNTVHIANELWSQPQLRAAVASEAQNATAGSTTTTTAVSQPASSASAQTTPATTLPSLSTAVADAETLPVGWAKVNQPSQVGWWSTVIGWLISIGAISLGAPFWFDLLGKMNSLRSSGPPPTK